MKNKLTKLAAALAVAALALAGAPASATGSIEIRKLKAQAPSWFTPSYAEQVLAAGPRGLPLPDDARVPASSLAFVGIRPGQQIIIADNEDLTRANGFSLCTSNFLFKAGSTGGKRTSKRTATRVAAATTYAIGTAGHCGKVGDKVFMVFAPLGVAYLGEIIKSTGDPGNRLAPDFALVSINPALNQWVSPSMAHWGGPTGVYTGDDIVPIVHSGHGLVVGTSGTPRAGVAYQWGTEYRFEGVVTPGDSGSAANVAGGLAAGNITHIAVNTRETVPVWNGGTSIEAILGYVGSYTLMTCSLPVPWPAPGCPPV